MVISDDPASGACLCEQLPGVLVPSTSTRLLQNTCIFCLPYTTSFSLLSSLLTFLLTFLLLDSLRYIKGDEAKKPYCFRFELATTRSLFFITSGSLTLPPHLPFSLHPLLHPSQPVSPVTNRLFIRFRSIFRTDFSPSPPLGPHVSTSPPDPGRLATSSASHVHLTPDRHFR